jgi:hypothetical protein
MHTSNGRWEQSIDRLARLKRGGSSQLNAHGTDQRTSSTRDDHTTTPGSSGGETACATMNRVDALVQYRSGAGCNCAGTGAALHRTRLSDRFFD